MFDKKIIIFSAATVLFFVVLLIVNVINDFYMSYKRDMRDLKYYHNTYLTMNGATSLYGPETKMGEKYFNYYFKSLDSGKNWYVINQGKNKDEVIIMGRVEDIYPGFLEKHFAWEKLTDHVIKNGSISLKNKEKLNILKDAGFEIK